MDNDTIVFSGDLPPATISGRVARGELRRLTTGVYTDDTVSTLETVARRHWRTIAGRLYPNAVISDRSAVTFHPADGYLFLVHDARDRTSDLPGFTIVARRGAAPLPDDLAIPGGLHQASIARAVAENARPSRSSGRRPARTLDAGELAAFVDDLCRKHGETALAAARARAAELADTLGTSARDMRVLGQLGAALQTQDVISTSPALTARQRGIPYDPERIVRFVGLVAALRQAAPQHRAPLAIDSDDFAIQAFWEAYFSNFIEGTEFTVGEAKAIIYDRAVPDGRGADTHDVTGTFEIVSNPLGMSTVPTDATQLLEVLRDRHAGLFAGRPEATPGEFKLRANQAGSTVFVAPALVEGTLRAGFEHIHALDSAWERAVFMAFLVAETHPFVDGNGRIARVMMNAELVAGHQSKIIVPMGARVDYLNGLRQLSRHDDPAVYIDTMRFLHDYTAQIRWHDHASTEADLVSSRAFSDDERLRFATPLPPLAPPAAAVIQPAYVQPYLRNGRPVSGYRKPRRR